MGGAVVRFDPKPVLDLAQRQLLDAGWVEAEHNQFRHDVVASRQRIADRCGVTPRTVHRWYSGVQLSERTADRVAIALGTHPALLWPEWAEWADLLNNCPKEA